MSALVFEIYPLLDFIAGGWEVDDLSPDSKPEMRDRSHLPWFERIAPALEGMASSLANKPMEIMPGVGGCRVHILSKEGQDFGWHKEGTPQTISCSLFLSTLNYKTDGGELEVKPPKGKIRPRMTKSYPIQYGDIVFFPSQWEHRVAPLKKDVLRVAVACVFRPC